MGAASDLGDARVRAARVLGAFEAAVKGDTAGVAALRGGLDTVLRDNAILKRAVAIQNARQQEAAAAAQSEIAELKATIVAHQAQLSAAQLNAYSLQMHLREALAHAHRSPPEWVT